jgi:hypothetical protein
MPGLLATNRIVSDPNNTVKNATLLMQGMSVIGYNRYGDYFGSGKDFIYPSYNWLAGQFQGRTGWETFIASLTSAPINLSNDLEKSLNPEITTEGANVYVVWDNQKDIFFKKSINNGTTFENTINLSNNNLTHFSGNKKIAVDGNNIYVVWEQKTEDNCCWSVMFRSSSNGGMTFEREIILATDNQWTNFGSSSFPQLAVAENRDLFVVWRDNSMGNEEILFKKSSNNGGNFSASYNLSRSPGMSTFPYVAASSNNVYVVWYDNTPGQYQKYHVLFTKSIDNGDNFGIVKDLGDAERGHTNFGLHPWISIFQNNVYVAWEYCCGNKNIFFRASLDNGNNFGGRVSIQTPTGGGSGNPSFLQLITDTKNVYVAWQDLKRVLLSISNNNGSSFNTKVLVDNRGTQITPYLSPDIRVSDGKIFTTWFDRDRNNNYRVNIRNSIDNGNTFGNMITLSSFSILPLSPSSFMGTSKLSISENNNAYVVWADNSLGNFDIFFKQLN